MSTETKAPLPTHINWKKLGEHTPSNKHPLGFEIPFPSCLVWMAAGTDHIIGGIFEVVRWDVERETWHEGDVRRTGWELEGDFDILYFSDEINIPGQ